jgi:2-hydroxychromene-2-carboxylate isomerase
MRTASGLVTSTGRRALMRRAHALGRELGGGRPVVSYFHQADDPYSHLACQVLGRFARRYDVELKVWLVSPPNDGAAPEREKLRLYGLRDARLLARKRGLAFPTAGDLPDAEATRAANAALAGALEAGAFVERAPNISAALWSGLTVTGPFADGGAALKVGDDERARLGHYLGAMFHFEGEWYWGVDRLAYLEQRLAALGLDRYAGEPPIAPPIDAVLGPTARVDGPLIIEVWFSFRSPYSWLVMPRIRALAAHYGATLKLRFILPMVMRGLPIPKAKGRYIVFDCKREAERANLPFGKIVDPVGAGAERALAVLNHAIPHGLGEQWSELALRGAWADGLALAEDKDLYAIARRAGLTDAQTAAALADDGWRGVAEANRADLFEAGLWGAPTFRLNGGVAHWGQDRLWALEDDILACLASAREPAA